jgi:hypothetical protein
VDVGLGCVGRGDGEAMEVDGGSQGMRDLQATLVQSSMTFSHALRKPRSMFCVLMSKNRQKGVPNKERT